MNNNIKVGRLQLHMWLYLNTINDSLTFISAHLQQGINDSCMWCFKLLNLWLVNIYNYMLALTNVLITFTPTDVTNQHLYQWLISIYNNTCAHSKTLFPFMTFYWPITIYNYTCDTSNLFISDLVIFITSDLVN